MNTDKLKQHARAHGPAAAIATTAAIIAAVTLRPGRETSIVWRAPERHAPPAVAHLSDCGDAAGAVLTQEDETRGQITLGPGAGGHCTLRFARPWASTPHCAITNGRVAELDGVALTIEQAAPVVTYDCAETP